MTRAADVVCGLVNARNSYGGYTGFQVFTANFGHDNRIISQPHFAGNDDRMAYALQTICHP